MSRDAASTNKSNVILSAAKDPPPRRKRERSRSFAALRMTVVLVLLLSACATATVENYDAMLNGWIGKSESDLVNAWGVPDKSYTVEDGTRYIAYARTDVVNNAGFPASCNMYVAPGNIVRQDCMGGIAPSVEMLRCETTFKVVKEKIAGWNHKGNHCRL